MKKEILLRCCLREAISQKDWGDATHYSKMLLNGGCLNNSRRGWRFFNCEKFQINGETRGCGAGFLRATRDFASPSLDSCPECREELVPVFGFFDEDLKVSEYSNLMEIPKDVFL